MGNKIYPDSGVELKPFTAKHYDSLMNTASFGLYKGFIKQAIKDMDVQPNDTILDLGCGTGRNAGLMASCLSEEGSITGLDVSEIMEKQFNQKFLNDKRVRFIRQRADIPFDLGQQFDKILISFVIHGFPHEVRKTVIKNIYNHLKPGGSFFMLDFSEFNMAEMPVLHRFVFKTIECKYAFDFIEKDWKLILIENGFSDFKETFYMKKYVRLLKAVKVNKKWNQNIS
jgi:demethylmenaquinone methyltransferase/2-methoxy-6-polyprenyl-1,4-benzoquinol methylase